MIKKAFSVRSPFFIPLWRRLVVFGSTLVWGGVEIIFGSPVWALIMLVVATYLAFQFFVGFDVEALKREQDGQEREPGE